MSIRPVDFNGMIQRTQDVSTLKQNEDNNVFLEKAKAIAEEKSKYFSSDIQISYNTTKRLNPMFRSPLCIVLENFNENGFYKYYNETT